MEKSQPTKPETESGTTQPDGTEKILIELGLPVTRENYLRLQFQGTPPKGFLTEPLPEGLEDELPAALQIKQA